MRTTLCVLLALPVLFTAVGWFWKLAAVLFVVAMTGSTRDSRIVGDQFYAADFWGFVPIKRERCKLKFVVQIETGLRLDNNATDWLLFLGFPWLMDRLMQPVWPWMAGEFELWLITARDRRILAWRGNREDVFQHNLQTLVSATGVAVRRL